MASAQIQSPLVAGDRHRRNVYGMTDARLDRIATAYRRFADEEARGQSPLYEALARGVAESASLLQRLAGMPLTKRQPNLLLAAARHVAGVTQDWPSFCRVILARWDEIQAVMLTHSTQTNEPGRCATLLPVFAQLPQPLALIEVGASAGLCLLADRYAYCYGNHTLRPDDAWAEAPVFPCRASSNTPLPTAIPRIVWRAGLDLNPLDAANATEMAWLETLVWPEQTDRAARLRAAVRIAQAHPPRVVQGDLRNSIAAVAADAPKDATLVVFHTAVLGYLRGEAERRAFARSVGTFCDYWVSNEAPGVLPDIATPLRGPPPRQRFLLAVNGAPLAWTDPHGAAIEWIDRERRPAQQD
jgi:hypothetical protein